MPPRDLFKQGDCVLSESTEENTTGKLRRVPSQAAVFMTIRCLNSMIVDRVYARGGVIHFAASEQVEQVTARETGWECRLTVADSHVLVLPPWLENDLRSMDDNWCLEWSPSPFSLAGSTDRWTSDVLPHMLPWVLAITTTL